MIKILKSESLSKKTYSYDEMSKNKGMYTRDDCDNIWLSTGAGYIMQFSNISGEIHYHTPLNTCGWHSYDGFIKFDSLELKPIL